MKIFQIFGGLCHWDATRKHPNLESTVGKYASDIIFVEAPDYVFEGWGYDDTVEGDARFIKPTAPDGWAYDDATGTFYPLNPEPEPETVPTVSEQITDLQSMAIDYEYRLILLELGVTDNAV